MKWVSALFVLATLVVAKANDPIWIHFSKGETVYALAVEGNLIWASTNKGLVRIAKDTKEKVYFRFNDYGLPDVPVKAIAINKKDKWFATYGNGLLRYDNTKWEVYNTKTTQIPSDSVYSVSVDEFGNVWLGTEKGMAFYREGGVVLKFKK